MCVSHICRPRRSRRALRQGFLRQGFPAPSAAVASFFSFAFSIFFPTSRAPLSPERRLIFSYPPARRCLIPGDVVTTVLPFLATVSTSTPRHASRALAATTPANDLACRVALGPCSSAKERTPSTTARAPRRTATATAPRTRPPLFRRRAPRPSPAIPGAAGTDTSGIAAEEGTLVRSPRATWRAAANSAAAAARSASAARRRRRRRRATRARPRPHPLPRRWPSGGVARRLWRPRPRASPPPPRAWRSPRPPAPRPRPEAPPPPAGPPRRSG